MSKIHYFQRYSSPENTVTNNTLQLIARVYSYSADKASELLSNLIGDSVEIGVEILQQSPGNGSIPDGSIAQRSFKILIEAKVDSAINRTQLLNHALGFSNEDQKILLLLTKQKVTLVDEEELAKDIRKQVPGVHFKCITYEEICDALNGLFQPHESEMLSVAWDYRDYCNDTGLSDQSRFLMRVVPCGATLKLNLSHGVYYDSRSRRYTNHQYVGIYKDKCVQCIWKLASVFDVDVVDGRIAKKTKIQGEETDRFDDRILSIVRESIDHCGFDVRLGHRFFCGDPIPTMFKKTSYGGIQGKRFINIKEVIGAFDTVEDVATRLSKETWQ